MRIGILGILTIIFVIAKLAGYIIWPWLWVLAPLWIPMLMGVAAAIFILVAAAAGLIE